MDSVDQILIGQSQVIVDDGVDCNSNYINKTCVVNAADVDENSSNENEHSEHDNSSDDDLVRQSIELFKQSDFSPGSVKILQRKDNALIPIIDYLENGCLPALQREARCLIVRSSDYILTDSLLFHRRNSKCKRTRDFKPEYQLVLPKILIKLVLELFHDSPLGGHGGIKIAIDTVSEDFYFDKLPSIVTQYVKSCHDCQTSKITRAHTKSSIVAYRTPSEPFQV